MPNRILATLSLAAALCAAPVGVAAVTVPLAGPAADADGLPVEISLDSLSRRLSAPRLPGGPGDPNAGLKALAAMVQVALDKMPWLTSGQRTNGLWTWRRNPTMGVAIYGPGTGGYSSFSWSRKATAGPPAASPHLAPIQAEAAPPGQPAPAGRGRGGAPTPVPLPPAAPAMIAALVLLTLRRRRKT